MQVATCGKRVRRAPLARLSSALSMCLLGAYQSRYRAALETNVSPLLCACATRDKAAHRRDSLFDKPSLQNFPSPGSGASQLSRIPRLRAASVCVRLAENQAAGPSAKGADLKMTSVLATFSELKKHVNLKVSREIPAIDNIIFKLHYRATFLILLVSTLLVSSRQFIGEHIRCIADAGVPGPVIDSFCFFTSTFTVVKHMNLTALEEGEIPHPGVGPAAKRDEITHHAYYQWVPFVLFFQALLFYLPHYLWRSAEGGRLKMLVSGLHLASISLREDAFTTENGINVPSKKDKEDKINQIRTAFMNRLHLNRPWAYYLGICELMNFLNVLMQMYITNKFLGGAFISLGQDVAETDFTRQMDALDEVFPKVTKCTFHKYGPSGGIQKHDALCVMALNIINEKIYTFLWFWFIILAILTALGLAWRLLTMMLHSRSTYFNKMVFKMACPGKYNPWDVLKVTNEYYFGDWLFLYYIAKNVENYVFKELLQGLAQDLEERTRSMYRTLPQVEKEPLKKTDYSPKDADSPDEENSKMLLL